MFKENSIPQLSKNHQRIIAATTTGALLIGTLTGVGIYWARDTYTIQEHNPTGNTAAATVKTQQINTWAGTVSEVLAAAGIELQEHDEVTPKEDTPLQDGASITVKRAREYTIVEDGKRLKIWSTADSISSVLAEFADTGRDISIPASRSEERAPLQSQSNSSSKVVVKADGKQIPVEATSTDSVATLLRKAAITVSPIDAVLVNREKEQLQVTVERVKRGLVVTEKELPFDTEIRENPRLYRGQEKIISEGETGLEKTTYYRQTRGQQVLVNHLVATEKVREPKPKIIEKGTKEKPKTAEVNTPTPSAVANGDVWAALAQCESGGNPGTNTGNGYYGMYQFSLPTWQAVGGSGLPSENSAAEQTLRAQILQQRAGWGQWPHCARKLGLL